ncbi:ASCH domain-containing protein [Chryseobacterium indoltheticum]|uniref:ASCH domain-containing protein n=1 Tax=Chryseobacterium indoltheticum TaxID=254 RepID=A0A3G6N2Y4_9FLAO|nr:ASCH domain-containing protein [Chryseobacterium indoltheticum]AZA60788.1 ASCH domain-containing protein [Chryseobacterium indoltheticum]
MKALSIKQPWASLIAHGIKDIENRTWKTNFRGRIYIHASGQYMKAKSGWSLLSEDQYDQLPDDVKLDCIDETFPVSAIVGEVDIIDCVINHESIWAEKTSSRAFADQKHYFDKPIYNWVLANAVLYDQPILNVKGKLSLWEFENQSTTMPFFCR